MHYPAMALYTPGLERNAEMQRQPLGTFSALRRPSPVATQYKRQSEMYGQALRTLSRATRRGDAGAAMDAIKYRDQANASGFTPGGIQRNENVQGNIASREQDYQIGSQDLERKAALDRRSGGMSLSRAEGTGLTPDSPKSSSNGGEWVDVSDRGGDAGPAAEQNVGASLASGRDPYLRNKLSNLRDTWATEAGQRESEPGAMQAAYEKENGTPEQQATRLALSTRYDALVDKYKGQFSGLERTKGITDEDKASAVKTGAAKGEAYGRKFDETISRARDNVALARMDVAGRQMAVGDMQREVAGIREGNQSTLRDLDRTADNRQRLARKPTLEELSRQASLRFSRGR